jgi:hypothetical protein
MIFTFEEAFRILSMKGPARVISSKGTEYTVEAKILEKGEREGTRAIRAIRNKNGRESYLYIHSDCWGKNITCQRTRAGGIYDGAPNIQSWLKDQK